MVRQRSQQRTVPLGKRQSREEAGLASSHAAAGDGGFVGNVGHHVQPDWRRGYLFLCIPTHPP